VSKKEISMLLLVRRALHKIEVFSVVWETTGKGWRAQNFYSEEGARRYISKMFPHIDAYAIPVSDSVKGESNGKH
jgi:hypothetical protein